MSLGVDFIPWEATDISVQSDRVKGVKVRMSHLDGADK